MISTIRIATLIIFSLSLSNCSMLPFGGDKKEKTEDAEASSDAYQSSGLYNEDLSNEISDDDLANDRATSSESYEDDQYGDSAASSADSSITDSSADSATDYGSSSYDSSSDSSLTADTGSSYDSGSTYASTDSYDSGSSASDDYSSGGTQQGAGTEPLPIESLPEASTQQADVPGFKDGMYKVRVTCTMRSQPSTSASKEGTVRKGKKLWMEAHNGDWVKVFKRSGPVFINKVCL